MGTEKSFSLFQRWICILHSYCCFLLCLQSQPLGNNGADNGETKTLDCAGSSMTSACTGTHCVASCGNGKKVEMECPEEGIKIDGSTVTCGKKWEPKPCFPFCDKEGQPIPMNNGGTSRQARSSGDQKTVDCPPGSTINGTCVGTQCEVTCGNGKKVEMECPEGGINIT